VRSANLLIAIMAVCVALLACKKDKDEDKEAKPADGKAAAAASAKAKPTEAPSNKYSSGDVLKYMPKECTEGRFFVSLSRLIGPSKQAVDDMVKTMLTGTDPDVAEAREIVQMFKDGGIEFSRDLQEVAVCAGYKGQTLVAVGFHADQIKSGDALDLIAKAVEKANKKKPEKGTEAGIPMLTDKGGKKGMALPSPTVLLIVEDRSVVADAKQGGGASEFGDAASQMVWGAGDAEGDKITAKATPKGEDIELRVEVLPKGKKPDDLKIELEAMRAKAVKEMAGSPFAEFADDAKKVTFSVEGAKVVAQVSIARARIDALFKQGSTMKPEELMRAF
jgi:hypothetical protein